VTVDDDEHPVHILINDFQVMSVNGQPYGARGLQDTVVLPGHGEVVIRIPSKIFLASLSTTATLCSMAMVA
jgi:suppressor of ftsI